MEASIDRVLREAKTIAVVGLSPKPERASFVVASYLQQHGYHIIPVNPTVDQVLGQKSYPDLTSVPERIDVVDIFRRSEDVPPVVDEAIRVGAKVIWMQEGVINEAAATKARQAGLEVIMDRCMLKEHRRMSNPLR